MRHKWIVLVLLLVLTACGGGGGAQPSMGEPQSTDTSGGDMATGEMPTEAFEEPAMEEAPAPPSDSDGGGSGVDEALPTQAQSTRRIVYTAFVQLSVDDPLVTARALQGLALRFNGFVSDTNIYETGDDTYAGTIQLRVDTDQFSTAMDEIRALGTEVLTEQLDTADVTSQYVDLEARIRTLEATEEELLALLTEVRQRPNSKTEDILTVHRELTTIRSEIEQYQGQLNVLSDSVSLATINVELVGPEAQIEILDEGWSPSRTFREALRTLTVMFQGLADVGIRFVVVALPVLLIFGLVLLVLFQVARWLVNRGSSRPTPPPTPSGD